MNFEAYMKSVCGGLWDKASPTAFPNLVMSSVGGQVSIATGLKGVASTMVGGTEVGFTLLSTAAESLLHRTDVDAIAVVAADELSPLFTQLESTRKGGSPPLPLAEGAVAFVLERADSAARRGIRIHAELAGWAQSFEGISEPEGKACGGWLEQAARLALKRADCEPEDIAAVTTLACGDNAGDACEAAALAELFADNEPPITALNGSTGFAESTSALYATVSAVLALTDGSLSAPAGVLRDTLSKPWLEVSTVIEGNTALALGRGEFGGNGAIVVRKSGAACKT